MATPHARPLHPVTLARRSTTHASRACPRFATRPRRLLALAALALAVAVPGAAATTVPGGTIAASTTWTLAGSPYVVQGAVTVGAAATLTVAAGVQVRFAIGAELSIVDGGALVAQGSAGQPIAFTSDAASPGRGDWYYIRAFAGARLRLTHCEVAWAGRGNYSALIVYATDTEIRNCSIHDNAFRAVHLDGAGLAPVLADTQIQNNGEIAIYQTTVDMTPTYQGVSMSGNGTDAVVIPGGTVHRAVTIDGSAASLSGASPLITAAITVAGDGALTITPGTTLRFAYGTELNVSDGGWLTAQGTPTAGIAFTSAAAPQQRGDWYYLRAFAGAHLRLAHVDLAYAGRGNYSALLVHATDTVIAASRIHDNASTAVQLEGPGLAPSVTDTRIDHNGGAALYQGTINMAPALSNLTFDGNTTDALVIAAPSVTSPVTLDGSADILNGAPILISGGLTVQSGARLTIAPGTTLRLPIGYQIDVLGGGTMIAEGTSGEPIVIAPDTATPAAGHLYYLRAQAGATLRLEHVDLGYAGRGDYPALWLQTSDAVVRRCRIHHAALTGVQLDGAGLTPTLADLAVDHNGGVALYQGTINMAPAYANLSLTDNVSNALLIGAPSVTADVVLDGSAGIFNGAPIVLNGGLAVQSGGRLTIAPGTTIRLPIGYQIDVHGGGTMIAEGSTTAPIIIVPDTATPAPGSLYYLRALAGATMRLAHVDLGYAGRGNYPSLWLLASDAVVRDCRIHDGSSTGVQLDGAGLTPTLANLAIDHNNGVALYQNTINMAPVLADLAFSDNGRDVLMIAGGTVDRAVTLDGGAATISGKPVVLTGSLTVGATGALTIAAGTSVRLPVAAEINIAGGGTLIGNGTAAAPVVLTSDAATPQPGDWYYVRAFAGSHLRLASVDLSAAGRGAYPALQLQTTDTTLAECRIHGNAGDGIQTANEASPRMAGNHVLANAFGVRNTSAKSWVDARLTWWGDSSGPYHPTLNPNGKGNAVSDRVLFVPWLEDEAGTILSKVFVQVVGPSRASPGETVDYAVSCYAGEAVDDAVLMLSLPSAAEFKQATAGGIYWPARHEVFWRLGDLAPGDESTIALTVRFAWGMPNGIEDVAMALLGGRDLAPTVFDVSPYLDYVEETIVGVTPLSEGAIATERSSLASVEALAAQAEAAGFYLGGGARVSLSTGRELTLIDFIADAATTTVVREGDLVLATTLSPGKARIATAGGGMEWQFTGGARELSGDWLDDTPGSLGVQASSAARPITWGDCFTNCALTDKDMTYDMVARAQELGNSFLNTGECRKWLAKVKRGESNLDGWLLCKPALESSLNVGGVISQTLMDCALDCKIKDRFKHECRPGQSMARCDPNLTFNEWVFSKKGAVSKRNYWIWTCDPATKLWSKPTFKRCGTNEVCKDGWRDTSGEPCASGSCLEEDPEGLSVAARAACARLAADGLSCAAIPTTVRTARDPNAKHGVAGDVLPGQRLDYTVEFENEGSGTAYGVYIVDRLSEHVDDATLTVTGPGEYIPATREIFWTVGELAPKGETGSKGEVGLSVELQDGLPGGTVVSNQAIVYFPSVPEETPTNTVVNVVQPVTATPQSVATTYTTPVGITLSGAEVSGLPLTFAVVERPANGELSGVPPALTYTPAEDFVGEDRFTFTAGNGTTTSRPAPVVVAVASSASDTEPPEVLWVTPAAGAEADEVSLLAFDSVTGGYGPPLLVQLSEPIAPGSVDGATTVVDASGRVCPTLVWFDATSNRVVVVLRERWQPTVYTATVTAAVADLAGNHLAAPYTWSFTARPPGWVRERLWSVP